MGKGKGAWACVWWCIWMLTEEEEGVDVGGMFPVPSILPPPAVADEPIFLSSVVLGELIGARLASSWILWLAPIEDAIGGKEGWWWWWARPTGIRLGWLKGICGPTPKSDTEVGGWRGMPGGGPPGPTVGIIGKKLFGRLQVGGAGTLLLGWFSNSILLLSGGGADAAAPVQFTLFKVGMAEIGENVCESTSASSGRRCEGCTAVGLGQSTTELSLVTLEGVLVLSARGSKQAVSVLPPPWGLPPPPPSPVTSFSSTGAPSSLMSE